MARDERDGWMGQTVRFSTVHSNEVVSAWSTALKSDGRGTRDGRKLMKHLKVKEGKQEQVLGKEAKQMKMGWKGKTDEMWEGGRQKKMGRRKNM